jgi:hypothetical protein
LPVLLVARVDNTTGQNGGKAANGWRARVIPDKDIVRSQRVTQGGSVRMEIARAGRSAT